MAEPVLPCLVCGRVLVNVFPEEVRPLSATAQQPEDAVSFRSPGQYGSTVFDPQDETYLEINVCDGCLRQRAGWVLLCRPGRAVRRHRSAQLWVPDDH